MKYLLLIAALILAGCSDSNAVEDALKKDDARFAQLSSAINQTETDIRVELIDGIEGMTYDPVTGLEVQKKGAYFIVLAPQVGPFIGCSNFWLAVNTVDLDNSNVRICQTDAGTTDVIISQGVVELEAGDRLQFRQSGALGIVAVTPPNEPLVPSVIISVFKL